MATPYSEDERQQLVSMFESLDVKPKMDIADDLKNWMADYVQGQGRMAIQVINWPQVQYPMCQ